MLVFLCSSCVLVVVGCLSLSYLSYMLVWWHLLLNLCISTLPLCSCLGSPLFPPLLSSPPYLWSPGNQMIEDNIKNVEIVCKFLISLLSSSFSPFICLCFYSSTLWPSGYWNINIVCNVFITEAKMYDVIVLWPLRKM